jgi:hypothetical protein
VGSDWDELQQTRGVVVSDGEFVWELSDVAQVGQVLAQSEYAILGGEILAIGADGAIWGVLPGADDQSELGVWGWDTPVWEPANETWSRFCLRGANFAAEMAARTRDELPQLVRVDLRSRLYVDLTYVTQANWGQLAENVRGG